MPLSLRYRPVLDADAFTGHGMGKARDIAGREDPGRAGLELVIDQNPIVDLKARLLGQVSDGPYSYPTTTRSAGTSSPLLRSQSCDLCAGESCQNGT